MAFLEFLIIFKSDDLVTPFKISELAGWVIKSFFLESQKEKRSYFTGYFYSSILLALAIVSIHFISINSKMNVDYISAIGLVIWAILSYVAINTFIPKKKK